MKTERVTILTSPEFKAFLTSEAEREQVSVAELVRSRCEQRPSEEEAVLAEMTRELNRAVAEAKKSIKASLADTRSLLLELQANRERRALAEAPVGVLPAAASVAARPARRSVGARA